MKKATLALIFRNEKTEILLGLKRGGPEIGDGTLNGPGGKKEPDETLLDCLLRETREEVGLELDSERAEKLAIITFYAAGEPSFEVHIYETEHFTGEPQKTESMIPGWYDVSAIPFRQMLESDQKWFPQLLRGEKFNANVYYERKAEGFIGIDFLPFEDHD